ALDVGGEIAVAELKPGLAAERRERRHEGPGFLAPAPALLGVAHPRERVHERVEVGRDRKPEMLEIVAGVGDDDQLLRRQDPAQAERELGATDPTGERHDHRNKSSSGGRTSVCPALAGALHSSPRTSTTGSPSAAWPITSEAAAAT